MARYRIYADRNAWMADDPSNSFDFTGSLSAAKLEAQHKGFRYVEALNCGLKSHALHSGKWGRV